MAENVSRHFLRYSSASWVLPLTTISLTMTFLALVMIVSSSALFQLFCSSSESSWLLNYFFTIELRTHAPRDRDEVFKTVVTMSLKVSDYTSRDDLCLRVKEIWSEDESLK